jgi:hypothetical protein
LATENDNDRRVYAEVDDVWRRIKEAETAPGHPIMPRELLEDRWMESQGLVKANSRLARLGLGCLLPRVRRLASPRRGWWWSFAWLAERPWTLAIFVLRVHIALALRLQS